MNRVIGIVALAFFGFGCFGGQAKERAPSHLRIAYNVFFDVEKDNYEIFVMNPDGSGKKNISRWKGVDWVYYAYGDKIYFVSDRDAGHRQFHLYEMDANGENVRKISRFLLVDSWLSSRKNGQEFVVCSDKDGAGHELYLIDRNGVELARLTNNAYYENDPAFSPDGRRIVFRSKRSGHGELWMMDASGGEQRRLTRYPEDDDTLRDKRGYHAGPPVWEPNRDLISFCSKRNGNYSIFTVKPDGSGLAQVTPDGRDEMWHDWSPDGRWLAFDGTQDGKNYDIYLRSADGGEIKRLTDDPAFEQAPVFVAAPRGQR